MATAEGDDREAAALLDQSTGDEDADTVELRLGENEDSFFDSDRSEAVPKGGSRRFGEEEKARGEKAAVLVAPVPVGGATMRYRRGCSQCTDAIGQDAGEQRRS